MPDTKIMLPPEDEFSFVTISYQGGIPSLAVVHADGTQDHYDLNNTLSESGVLTLEVKNGPSVSYDLAMLNSIADKGWQGHAHGMTEILAVLTKNMYISELPSAPMREEDIIRETGITDEPPMTEPPTTEPPTTEPPTTEPPTTEPPEITHPTQPSHGPSLSEPSQTECPPPTTECPPTTEPPITTEPPMTPPPPTIPPLIRWLKDSPEHREQLEIYQEAMNNPTVDKVALTQEFAALLGRDAAELGDALLHTRKETYVEIGEALFTKVKDMLNNVGSNQGTEVDGEVSPSSAGVGGPPKGERGME